MASHPRFTADGRFVIYVLANGFEESRLVVAPVGDLGEVTEITRCDGGCGAFDVGASGHEVVFSTSRPYRRVNQFRDLVVLPLDEHVARNPGPMRLFMKASQNKYRWCIRFHQ